jgi:hypothetical protein
MALLLFSPNGVPRRARRGARASDVFENRKFNHVQSESRKLRSDAKPYYSLGFDTAASRYAMG